MNSKKDFDQLMEKAIEEICIEEMCEVEDMIKKNGKHIFSEQFDHNMRSLLGKSQNESKVKNNVVDQKKNKPKKVKFRFVMIAAIILILCAGTVFASDQIKGFLKNMQYTIYPDYINIKPKEEHSRKETDSAKVSENDKNVKQDETEMIFKMPTYLPDGFEIQNAMRDGVKNSFHYRNKKTGELISYAQLDSNVYEINSFTKDGVLHEIKIGDEDGYMIDQGANSKLLLFEDKASIYTLGANLDIDEMIKILNSLQAIEPDLQMNNKQIIEMNAEVELFGMEESFLCKYGYEKGKSVVEEVYSVEKNGLTKLGIHFFEGQYKNFTFSFEYALINSEICAFNEKGAIDTVFYHRNGDYVYAKLEEEKDGYIEKEYLVILDLENGEVYELTNATKPSNCIMSPNGNFILRNYRADGYWTILDVDTGEEKKVEGIDGYAHIKEITFVEDNHILTLGKQYEEDNYGKYSTYLIDLETRDIVEEYMGYGEINMQWTYDLKEEGL